MGLKNPWAASQAPCDEGPFDAAKLFRAKSLRFSGWNVNAFFAPPRFARFCAGKTIEPFDCAQDMPPRRQVREEGRFHFKTKTHTWRPLRPGGSLGLSLVSEIRHGTPARQTPSNCNR
jgi:hypothetical protein